MDGQHSGAMRFNPRPDPRTGATPMVEGQTALVHVSIRAPIRGPGRHENQRRNHAIREFQSAPRSEDRGDALAVDGGVLEETVSIRAPLRGPGRLGATCFTILSSCFNPRPDPRTGATRKKRNAWSRLWSFNPRPDPRTGATFREGDNCDVEFVSIRAPIRGPGRLSFCSFEFCGLKFQSAPRSEDRGDVADAVIDVNDPVSIRAPIRGPGRHSRHVVVQNPFSVSIRAPIRGPGRRENAESIFASDQFQSAPRSEDRGDRV